MTTTPATPGRPQSDAPAYDADSRDTAVPVDTTVPARTAVPVETTVVDDPDTVREHRVLRDEELAREDRARRADGVVRDEGVHDDRTLRQDVVGREKEEFGGFKLGAAFFGWLAATGTAVLLTSLLAALGAAFGLGVTDETAENAGTITLVGAIALAVVLFVAYFAGGYVAGRMARFSGAKQGLAVWLWALVFAVAVAIIGAMAGSQFNILANLNAFPRIPVNEGDLTVVGVVTAVIVAGITLLGAVLGGLAGMRYHRRVDRVGLGR